MSYSPSSGRGGGAFERMIGRRTTPRLATTGASSSPRGAADAAARPAFGAFPSEPPGGSYPTVDEVSTSSASPATYGSSRASPRSGRARGTTQRRTQRSSRGRGFDEGFGNDAEDSDDDFALHAQGWGESANDELYGAEPHPPFVGQSRRPQTPSEADSDGFKVPSPVARSRGRPSGRDSPGGGGGGKTRTRCRPISSGPIESFNARARSAFDAALDPSRPKGLASRRQGMTQAVQRRRRNNRARPDTSDEDSDASDCVAYEAELYVVAPSPAVRPARAPQPVPGQFTLPLSVEEGEEATELLLMSFELR